MITALDYLPFLTDPTRTRPFDTRSDSYSTNQVLDHSPICCRENRSKDTTKLGKFSNVETIWEDLMLGLVSLISKKPIFRYPTPSLLPPAMQVQLFHLRSLILQSMQYRFLTCVSVITTSVKLRPLKGFRHDGYSFQTKAFFRHVEMSQLKQVAIEQQVIVGGTNLCVNYSFLVHTTYWKI